MRRVRLLITGFMIFLAALLAGCDDGLHISSIGFGYSSGWRPAYARPYHHRPHVRPYRPWYPHIVHRPHHGYGHRPHDYRRSGGRGGGAYINGWYCD